MSETTLAPAEEGLAAKRRRVFSGVQPSGKLHIGNYVGALKQWADSQHLCDNIFCVVDLHALTIPEQIDPAELKENSRRVAALYFACGIDPDESVVFIQSHVPEHSELAWTLGCVTPLGWLYRMTQFKTKSQQFESVGTGLLTYPTLQAADILLYDTEHVPVGEDQRQHIELTRDIALRFNHLFGDVFVLPEAVIPRTGARIMGLDDPETKMSKSLAVHRPLHSVGLLDDAKTVEKAIMSAVTDSGMETRFAQAGPGVRNLLTLYHALTGEPEEVMDAKFEGKGYGYLKKTLAQVAIDTLAPIQARFKELLADPAELDATLAKGAERARAMAAPTMAKVRRATGTGG